MTRDEKRDLFSRLYGGTPEREPETEEKQEVAPGTPKSRSAIEFLGSVKRQDNAQQDQTRLLATLAL